MLNASEISVFPLFSRNAKKCIQEQLKDSGIFRITQIFDFQ